MRITRTPLARVLTGGFALAAATALVLPGIAAADEDTTPEADAGVSSSSLESIFGSDSLGSLPIEGGLGDFFGAMAKIASGEIDVDAIGECVKAEFGKVIPDGNPIQIIVNCIAGGDNADSDDTENEDVEGTAAGEGTGGTQS